MNILPDKERTQALFERYGLERCFETEHLPFQLREYSRGEFLCTPVAPLESLLLMLEGTVHFFDLNQNGQMLPVGAMSSLWLLGDVEFITRTPSQLYAQAQSRVLCLALPIEANRAALEEDRRFLRFLSQSLAAKLSFQTSVELPSTTIEERVRFFLERESEGHCLRGIASTALRLRCSRRQLLRALKQLCERGEVEKIGHGVYRLRQGIAPGTSLRAGRSGDR